MCASELDLILKVNGLMGTFCSIFSLYVLKQYYSIVNCDFLLGDSHFGYMIFPALYTELTTNHSR